MDDIKLKKPSELNFRDYDSVHKHVNEQIQALGKTDISKKIRSYLLQYIGLLEEKANREYSKDIQKLIQKFSLKTKILGQEDYFSREIAILREQRTKLNQQLGNVENSREKKPIISALHRNFEKLKQIYIDQKQERRKIQDRIHENENILNIQFDERQKAFEQKKETRLKSIEELKERIRGIYEKDPYVKVPWKILPQGDYKSERIIEHFQKIQESDLSKKIDLERLILLNSLKPTRCYIGVDEFSGYIVFAFDSTKKFVFENPNSGNAIYIIDGNWQELSKLSKTELLTTKSVNVKRIIHKGNWFKRLKKYLF